MKTSHRIFASLGIVLLCTLMVLSLLVALARSGRIQTAVLGVVTEQLSRGLGAPVHVGHMAYKFPNRLLVEDVLVGDRQQDTLLFVDTLSARMDVMKLLRDDTLSVRRVDLCGLRLNAYRQQDSVMNYQFLIDALRTEKKEQKPFPLNLEVRDICLRRLDLRHDDWYASVPAADLHLYTFSATDIDASVEQFAAVVERSYGGSAATEQMVVEALEARFVKHGDELSFPELMIRLPHSEINLSECSLSLPSAPSPITHNPSPITHHPSPLPSLALRIEEASLTPADLAVFVPALRSMNSPWQMTADVRGRLDEIEAKDLSLKFRGEQVLVGEATAIGLPSLDSLYFRIRCTDLTTRRAQLQDILSGAAGHPVQLPPMLDRLGTVHYHGTLEGRIEDMTLAGAFTSAVGSIRTDGRASYVLDSAEFSYRGELSSRRLALGRLLGVPDMGNVAFSVHTDGHMAHEHPFEGNVCAKLDLFEYRGYAYRGIHIDGAFADHVFTGEASSSDPNLDLAFHGRMDFHRTDPVYAFRLALNHLRLGALHLSDKYADSDLRLHMDIDLVGGSLDRLNGHLTIDSLAFYHRGEDLMMRSFVLQANAPSADDPIRSLSVRSDYLDADVAGHFRYQTLLTSLMRFVGRYMPMLIRHDKRAVYLSSDVQNDVRFSVIGRGLDRLMDHLELAVSVPGSPQISGHIDDAANSYGLVADVPELFVGNNHLSSIRLDLVNSESAIGLASSAVMHHGQAKLSENLGDLRFGLSARAMRDSLEMALTFANTDTLHYAGTLSVGAHFAQYNHLPLITAWIRPDTLLLDDTKLVLSPSTITYNVADTALRVDHFRVGTESQYLYLDGIASPRPNDTLYADLREINLDRVLGVVTDLKKTIWFGGTVTGWARAYGLLRAPMFEASVAMRHAAINGSEIGDVYAVATLDPDSSRVLIQGECIDTRLPYAPAAIDTLPARHVYTGRCYDLSALVPTLSTPSLPALPDSLSPNRLIASHPDSLSPSRPLATTPSPIADSPFPVSANLYSLLPDSVRRSGRHVVHVDGEVGGGRGRWGLGIYPDSVELGFIEHWCASILTNVSGRGSGRCFVLGDKPDGVARTVVKVAAKPHGAGITLPFTGARYLVYDTIRMDTTYIAFDDMHLTDTYGNPVHLDGRLTHDGMFRDLRFGFDVKAQHALVLDLPEDGASLYAGHVFADGQVSITGDEHDVNILADAKTTRGSRFLLSLATESTADESAWIEYVSPAPDTLSSDTVVLVRRRSSPMASHTHFGLQLRAEVTPEADVSVLIDRRTGDRLRGRGEGNLRLNLTDDDISLLGTYTLQQGTFGFTFQNVIRREFRIDEGSSVTWSGDPVQPEVDIRALYRITASLRDLLGSDVSGVTDRSSVPVNCILHLTQSLMNPLINFGIELPSSDEAVASQVRAAINTDEMLMRQVLYLLVFGRFYTPEYLQNTNNVGLNETYSLLSSTVTGQINSWLGKITDVVTLGFNFRTDGEGADASQEYEAQFEIHPVRGLLINGNLGYRYNDISNQPVFGNLDVEYMLTPNGKLRAKAFTHTVDKYSLRQANTVQGVGFVLRHDFNWPTRRSDRKAAKSSADSVSTASPSDVEIISTTK